MGQGKKKKKGRGYTNGIFDGGDPIKNFTERVLRGGPEYTREGIRDVANLGGDNSDDILGWLTAGHIGINPENNMPEHVSMYKSSEDAARSVFIGGPGGEAAVRGIDEGIGEMTGRNVQREQMARAEERFRQEQKNRKRLRLDDLRYDEMRDLAASRAAGSRYRSRGTGASASSYGELGGSGDFLGL
jgi:hypothetical protein